jgi:pimeloyl-ACP methyl ester carboxylesterase
MATFVLVHGAWAGGVVWRLLAPTLRKSGHEVYVPTLTGVGERKHLLSRNIDLTTHIQDVVGVIDDEDLSDVVLVGHSYGGMVITGVADRRPDSIASLVYLDAAVPENGQSMAMVVAAAGHGGKGPDFQRDWLVQPLPSAAFGLKRPEVIRLWETKATPQPAATFTQPLTLTSGSDRISKKTFIYANDPQPTTFTQFYDKLKDRPDWAVHTLPCTHFAQLEMPEELAALLLQGIA